MELSELYGEFERIYGTGKDPELGRAPGSVNLIGEHTDYNRGLVLPIAVDLTTYALIRKTDERVIRLHSANLEKTAEFELDRVGEKSGDWTDYVRGILSCLGEGPGNSISGFDLYLASEVPVGRGLSSSAALELSVASAINRAFDLTMEDLELIELCQRAENEFVGANTGIMDQYVSYFGRRGTALLIDTARPSHDYVDLNLSGYGLLVVDTTVSHAHGGSEYNKRREECEESLKIINERGEGKTVSSLSKLSPVDLENTSSILPETLSNRVRHVVEENQRVNRATNLFKKGKIEKAGRLFYASHSSLRELYEVSSPELDFLVNFARAEQIPGARMTGGGFGGATIHLVPEDISEEYVAKAKREFFSEFSLKPKAFSVSPSDGVKEYQDTQR